jgi:hypothetical protein
MSLRRSLPLMLLPGFFAALLVGCASAPAPAPAPPAAPQSVSTVQDEYQVNDHGARAGTVVKVRTDTSLAAVLLIPSAGSATESIVRDDPFTFIDSSRQPLANGKVVSIEGNLLVVSYTPISGGRAPLEGDYAVHLSVR